MLNYRVDDLHALIKALREEGCNVLEKIDESEYIDPEGNKVELWQPPANDKGRHLALGSCNPLVDELLERGQRHGPVLEHNRVEILEIELRS